MKKNIYLVLFTLIFVSCSNNEVYKNNAEVWVKANILPYLENSSINHELTQVVKMKDEAQCTEIRKILVGSYTDGLSYSLFKEGVSKQDASLIDYSSRLKIIANTQEDAVYYSSDCKYVSVSVKYKNKHLNSGSDSYLVVFDKNDKVLNSKIVKKYSEDLKMNVYLTEK